MRGVRESEQSNRAQISPLIGFLGGWRVGDRASAERCFSTPPPSDVIWFGVRGGEVLEKRERTNRQHKAQTNKQSSEAALLPPLWLYDGGMHAGILGTRTALSGRKGTLSHSFKSACNFKFQIPGAEKVFAHAIQGNWEARPPPNHPPACLSAFQRHENWS